MSSRWLHMIWGTHGAWIPGDARGFRNYKHRIHSSGDYRRRPPPDEHAGLRRYVERHRTGQPVILAPDHRERARDAITEKARRLDVEMACLAVASNHVHLLARMAWEEHREIVGKLKRHSSHALRDVLPGRVWGGRCSAKRIRDRQHQVLTYQYILRHGRKEGASVWAVRREG